MRPQQRIDATESGAIHPRVLAETTRNFASFSVNAKSSGRLRTISFPLSIGSCKHCLPSL